MQHELAHGEVDAHAGQHEHEQHHEHLLQYARAHAVGVDVHGLGDGHGAADVAHLHALLLVAELVELADGLAVAFEARLGHVQRLGVAEHAPPLGVVAHVVVRLEGRIGAEGLERPLLELVGRVRRLARGGARVLDLVVGVHGEQRAHRLGGDHAHEGLRAEGAVLGAVDGVLVDVDEVPHRVHLVGQHLGLLARLVLGLLLLQLDVPQRVDGHEGHDEGADEHRELEADTSFERHGESP